MEKDKNFSLLEIIALIIAALSLIVAIISLVVANNALNYAKEQLDWSEREANITFTLAGYETYTGNQIKEMCSKEGFECNSYKNSLKDNEKYNFAIFGLMNLGNRTLENLDINLRCNNCNFSAVIYNNQAITKRTSIHLPYSVYINLEKLPPTNSFEQVVFLVWKDNPNDSWWIQYSSYEINKREVVLEVKKEGKFKNYVV